MATGLAVAFSLVQSTTVRAYVSPIDLDELYWSSDLVVVGRTISVFDEMGWEVATFEIDQVIKGRPPSKVVRYLASPTWTCDGASAVPGTRVLMFLGTVTPDEAAEWALTMQRARAPTGTADDPVYRIAYSGRGSMVIDQEGGQEGVRHSPDVILPAALQADPDEDPAYYLVGSGISLAHMLEYLKRLSPTAPTPTPTADKGPISADRLRP